MNSKKNIIIVSARRSGTHLLTDLIVNNFGYESINNNYIDYYKFTDEMPIFESLMNEGSYSYKQPYVNHPKVTWTHSHDFKDYLKYNHSEEDNNKLNRFFSESKIILVYRDIRDIINSIYNRPRYKNKYKSFTDFYTNFDFDGYELTDQKYDNISDLLIQYYKNWFSVYMAKELLGLDMEIASFEEIMVDYDTTLEKIGLFLEQTPSGIDVRLPNKDKNIIYTTNDFRSGKTGEWVSDMNAEFGEKLGKKYDTDLGAGLNCFINDIQIHKYHTPNRDKFKNISNWKPIEEDLNLPFKSLDIDIEKRYEETLQRSRDFRYYHKVFYYDKYVLKFHYPCKATLDKQTFDSVIPTASKQQLLTILKTDEFLYKNGIIPKLYNAGIYNGILFVVQERYPIESVLYEKYKFHPKWGDWNWVVDMGFHTTMLKYFYKALDNNILLTDLFNVSNCAIDENGDLKYFDLDGIAYYETKEDMINSEDYKNSMGIVNELKIYYEKFGKSK